MEFADAPHHARDFRVVEWWPTVCAVSSEQQWQGDLGIDAMPQQMASEGCDGVVATSLCDAAFGQAAPVSQGMAAVLATFPQNL